VIAGGRRRAYHPAMSWRGSILVAAAAACGGGRAATPVTAPAGPVAPGEATPPVYRAQVYDACGPVDGPATMLVLTAADAGCRQTELGPHLIVTVWDGPSLRRPGPIDVVRGGEAMRCAGSDFASCQRATAATLEWGRAGLPGRVELQFGDGATVRVRFDERRCLLPVACG